MSAQTAFAALAKKARSTREVEAGLSRNAPNLRAVVQRQVLRFQGNDSTPGSIADEAVAFAVYGTELQDLFLDYFDECGGFARILEVVIAAAAYEHRTFEWDSSQWGIRRAPASAALGSQGLDLWAELRRRAKKASGKDIDRILDGATSRALLLRGALAFVFPKHKGLWSAEDDVAIRHYDVEDYYGRSVAVLPCLRHTSLEPKNGELPGATTIRNTLKEDAVTALRLTCEWDELKKMNTVDALHVLAEFADWGHLPDLEPKRAFTLAPLLGKQKPRRGNALRFVRGVLHRAALRDPKLASQSKDPIVAECLSESGALLPAAAWTSPWAVADKKKPAEKPQPPTKAKDLVHLETFHWTKEEQEQGVIEEGTSASESKSTRKELDRERKKGETCFLFLLSRMTDADAMATWTEFPADVWYGQVDDVQHPLIRFGLKALEPAIPLVLSKPLLLPALSGVDSPRVARLMARGFVKVKKMKDVGDAWLKRFPRAAAIGLLPELISNEKERRDIAAIALDRLRSHSPAVVDEVAEAMGADWKAFISASVKQTKKLPRKPTLPKWVDVATLPRPVLGKTAVQGDALEEVVALIKLGLAPEQKFEPASLSRLAWELFARWAANGAPPKEKWCMQSLGLFPADENAEALGPLAKHWAPSGSPTRAQDAVEVLASMRTPAGLAQLMMLSKVQSKALRAKAQTVFEKEAKELGLSTEDLVDRLVPDFGSLTLTTDDGELHVRFDAMLKPKLVDASGAEAKLPKNADDTAKDWWSAIESGAPPLGRASARRLERSMVEARQMTLEHFTETWALHPVLSQLARGVLWGEYGDDGKLIRALAMQDGAIVDVNGKKIEATKSMGVVHPADLDDASLATWKERITAQPFNQLQRTVKRVSQQELEKQARRVEGIELDTERLVKLARAGWKQGEAYQGGCYNSLERGGVTLSFTPGIYLGDWKLNARQTLETAEISPEPRASLRSEVSLDLASLSA